MQKHDYTLLIQIYAHNFLVVEFKNLAICKYSESIQYAKGIKLEP